MTVQLCVILVLSFDRHGGLHSFNLVIRFRVLGSLTLATLLSLLSVCFFDGALTFCVCLRSFTISVLKSIELSELLST